MYILWSLEYIWCYDFEKVEEYGKNFWEGIVGVEVIFEVVKVGEWLVDKLFEFVWWWMF